MNMNDKLRNGSFVIASIGIVDALYLSWVKLAHTEVFCGGSGNCSTVNSSSYSEISGIPIAWFGLGAYLAILFLLYMERRGSFWSENSTLLIFGITLAGSLYSAYLTYIEIAVLKAICPYCVLSAIAMVLLFIITIIRLMQGQTETKLVHSRGG
jgi:uncharacterized membrane protein